MKRFLLSLVAVVIGTLVTTAKEPATKERTHTVMRETFGGIKQTVKFVDRDSMKPKGIVSMMKLPAPLAEATVPLPIDWARSFVFPIYQNDVLGDCYYAAGLHADNTWTANTTVKSDFSAAAIKERYFALSGGDYGLGDSDMQGEMTKRYLADVKDAKIVDFLYVNPNNAQAMQMALNKVGVVMFTFRVAPYWINHSDPGDLWDGKTYQPNNNGHAVIFNGVDTRGYYKLQTWGVGVWITPSGVKACDPMAWVCFSTRWFNSKGFAPNGEHITAIASWWTSVGGKAIPASVINSFPPPGDVPPPPAPIPTAKTITKISVKYSDLSEEIVVPGGKSLSQDMTLKALFDEVYPKASLTPGMRNQSLDSKIDALAERVGANEKAILSTVKILEAMQKKLEALPAK